MTALAFYLYGGIQVILFVMALRIFLKQRRAVDLFLCLSSVGLVYDNWTIASGQFVGAGSTLMGLNAGRFILHALTTPLLAILGLALARNAKVEWAWTRKAQITYCVIALLCVAYGIYTDVIALKLVPNQLDGVLRYTNAASKGPPLAAITTMTLLLFLGISVFVKSKWPWLLVASITMFAVAAFASTTASVANLGEIVLIAGLVFTSRRFPYLSKAGFADSQTSLSIAQKTELAEQVRERKRKLANWNRSMAWVMFPMLVIGTIAYYRNGLGLPDIPAWVSSVFNNGFIVLFFIHSAASFYFYGIPKPKANIRVVHVYIGYTVFLFTMISQSFRAEPLHLITYLINWVVIGAHVTLSTRFMLKRVMNRKQDPLMEFAIGKKLALDK